MKITGAQILRLPYTVDPTTDDATILAHVGRWLDEKGDEVKADLAAYLCTKIGEEDDG